MGGEQAETPVLNKHTDISSSSSEAFSNLRVVRSISRERNHKREHTSNTGFLLHEEYLHVGCGTDCRAREQTENPIKSLSLVFLRGILPDALMAPEQPPQLWAGTGHLGHSLACCLCLGQGSGPFPSPQPRHECNTEPSAEMMKRQGAKPAPVFCQ